MKPFLSCAQDKVRLRARSSHRHQTKGDYTNLKKVNFGLSRLVDHQSVNRLSLDSCDHLPFDGGVNRAFWREIMFRIKAKLRHWNSTEIFHKCDLSQVLLYSTGKGTVRDCNTCTDYRYILRQLAVDYCILRPTLRCCIMYQISAW